ncbi:hypothetical protein HRR83_001695 [Exophiala dermatitidis]|uniref:LysM domain-containing protein n=2 Tax=Exophiala dermatitidis TaxID=5970 RepID=H6C5N9_EXODN|nr:uncharacterized protein HMPREF1120_07035 [Exophiala dermatitidis NIH/UT8656]KAJ4516366.1 hypothetical protein HRR73_004829 [Exophiala dermatitidis]EHY59035.1 hypothetical protein HMPREF1120_07035 [Exophiala dermatitidis NIH/UT8656]KAJ4523173.1 hypothetical protein HRR75_001572 [Exophiala dermatitidis]KAJ4526501.1 hypothetical protein HRR74_001699 [Exophiala dermatitidis]KAJ4532253.1 hypothetical protein HRR76_007251 [Exophiala dermatitidis]
MNTSSHPAGLYQSSTLNSSTSTLRPRAPRLISYIEDDTANEATAVSTSSLSTPQRFSTSRAVSPIADVDRARSTDGQLRNSGRVGTNTSSSRSSSAGLSSRASSGGRGGTQAIWEPWSSIQGLASTLLGDVPGPSKDKTDKPFKTPVWMKQDKRYGSKQGTSQWGPSSEASSGRPASNTAQAAIEERQALVQAKRREALLLANATEGRDSSGRYKRRDSDAGLSSNDASKQSDSEGEALVYLHKVEKNDTMAGVIIKYNCQAEPFRKVNRFWPNDNIQTRSHVLIPLEGCTARGRKVDSPYLARELASESEFGEAASTSTATNGPSVAAVNGLHPPAPASGISNPSNPSSLITSMSEETEYRHDSWVMLPNFKEPVEVVRVPRRALGYFPRARRKSNATTAADISTPTTPKTSFDMLRHPPTHAAQTSASLNTSPIRRPGMPSRLGSASSLSGRQRSFSLAAGHSSSSFADALRGPGGVGNLRGLRTEVAKPGPADDPLNRKLAQYLPDLLPPQQDPTTVTPPRTTAFHLRLATPRATTPRASTDSMRSTRSNSSGLGDVGGAIEGWVRKMAGGGNKREKGGGVAAGVDKLGDLIELETNANDTSGASGQQQGSKATAAASSSASVSATEEALLNERFPLRGRVRPAYTTATTSSSLAKDKDA